jgi:hypothetical protein
VRDPTFTPGSFEPSCPYCARWESVGHAADCPISELRARLAAAEAGAAVLRSIIEQHIASDPHPHNRKLREALVAAPAAGAALLAEHEAAMRVVEAAREWNELGQVGAEHLIVEALAVYDTALSALPAPEHGQKPVSVTDADRAEGARRHYAEPGSHGCSPCCIVEIEEEARKVAAERAHLPGSPGSPCDCGEERDVFATCQACGKFLEHGHDCGGERHE